MLLLSLTEPFNSIHLATPMAIPSFFKNKILTLLFLVLLLIFTMAFSRMNCRENTLVHSSESPHNAFSPLSEFDLVLGTTHDEAHRWRRIWKPPFDTFLQLKLCDDGGEEEEHLGLGERHSQALSSANQVGNQPLVLGELPRVSEKSVWPELSGLVPVLGVVHDVPEEGEDSCAGRHLVLADRGGLHVHVRGADEVDGGDPQHLVDERHCKNE